MLSAITYVVARWRNVCCKPLYIVNRERPQKLLHLLASFLPVLRTC
jgi:hypothetical protein